MPDGDPDRRPDQQAGVSVVAADEQTEVTIDVDRWSTLARQVLVAEGRRGELTLTFVGRAEMAALNREHMGVDAPTDVLSFPLDDEEPGDRGDAVPVLLGDVVVCPAVAAAAAGTHAGSVDDELALLVVHGVLHVVGHDHAEAADAERMRSRERHHLETLHWRGPAPAGFSHVHVDE